MKNYVPTLLTLLTIFGVSTATGQEKYDKHEECVVEYGTGIEGTIPGTNKLFESEGSTEALRQMQMPIARRDTALLPIVPARIAVDGGPNFFRRERNCFG